MGFEAYLKRWLNYSNKINESVDTNELYNLIDSGIGGDRSNQISKTTAFNTIDDVLDKIELSTLTRLKSNPELQKVVQLFTSPGKIDWVADYLTKSKKSLSTLTSDKKKIDTSTEFDKFTRVTLKEANLKSKIYKLFLIFKSLEGAPVLDQETNILNWIRSESIKLKINDQEYTLGKIGSIDNAIESNKFEALNDAGEASIFQKEELKTILEANPEIAEKAKAATSEAYQKKLDKLSQNTKGVIQKEIANSLNTTVDIIDNLPDNESTMEKLQIDWKPLLDALGYSKFYRETIQKKEEKSTAKERPSLRKKNRIKEKLMAALKLALLPPLVNGEISSPGGDYFKLFKALSAKNEAWLDAAIREVLVSQERISQFNNEARVKESSLEENQLTYLYIGSNWIEKYVRSEVDGELSKRDVDNSIAKIKTIVQEKEKEIKNYYLSKDFNMKSFKGIQLKPDLRLPLYQRVKLTVSEADRISESPLKNLIKGLGQIAVGLLSTVPLNMNQEIAKRNAEQNKAIFNGIFSIIKGGISAVSKQGARDFEKGVTNITNKTRLDAVGITPYKKEEGPAFYKSGDKKANEDVSPGTAMQTPASLPADTMDTLSLAGPGKKKKTKSKGSIISKVSSFKDFIKG